MAIDREYIDIKIGDVPIGIANSNEDLLENDEENINSSALFTKTEVERIPIDELFPDDSQPRKFKDDEKSLNGLIANITSCREVYTPIQYRIGEDGKKYIVMGERRWRSAKEAGLTEVPAMRYASKEDYRIAAYMDNQDRKKLLPMEEALYLKSLLNDLKIEQQELASKVNLSKSRLSEILKIASLEEYIQDEALTGSEWTAQKLLELAKIENSEDRFYVFRKMCESNGKDATLSNDVQKRDEANSATELQQNIDDSEESNISASYSKIQITKWSKSLKSLRNKVSKNMTSSLSKPMRDSYQGKIDDLFSQIENIYAEMIEKLEAADISSDATPRANSDSSEGK